MAIVSVDSHNVDCQLLGLVLGGPEVGRWRRG